MFFQSIYLQQTGRCASLQWTTVPYDVIVFRKVATWRPTVATKRSCMSIDVAARTVGRLSVSGGIGSSGSDSRTLVERVA